MKLPRRTLLRISSTAVVLAACRPSATPTATPAPAAKPTEAGAPKPAAAATKPAAAPKPGGARKKLVFGSPVTPPSMVHLPPSVALEMGYFEEQELDLEVKSFEGGVGALRAGLSGGLDVVGTSADPLIAAVAQNAPVKAIGAYAPRLSVVLTTQAGITNVEDLKGKKIGIQDVGGFNEVMVRLLLATKGLKPSDVQYVNITTAGRVPGLVSGQIDASVLHIDQYYNATKQKPDLVALAKMWEIAPDWWYSAYVASDQQIKENRDALIGFLTATTKAGRSMYKDKAKTVEIGVKHTKQPEDVVARAYDDLAKGGIWTVNDGMPEKSVLYTIDKQVEIGTIKPEQKPSLDKLIDRSLIDEAVKRNGGPMTGDPRWY
ncbi:MAG TPA: ABC transporter substrate-binding protein [Chloroflexota bacterium]|jgi:ABC-type nitrate/sulfonate/bicarbonate transport system substrate-binding protein|nr:ABC transporter substrate-binding protein [Chloroflexota bacterium]